jgi:hypothetical protein
MKSLEKLLKLADRFESKLKKRSQSQGAQAGEIERALKGAGLWVSSDEIAPLLNQAKIPGDVSLDIQIVVDSGLNVKFLVISTPSHVSASVLGKLLEKKYAVSMSKALRDAQLHVTDTVTAKLATFA